MFRSLFWSLPFGPLAAALLVASFATPFARDAGRGLRTVSEYHGALIADLRPTFGVELSALGPHIAFPDVPSRKPDGTVASGDRPLRLYPAELAIEINAARQVAERDGFRVHWILGDIRLTARFVEPANWSSYFPPNASPDWSRAVLRLPYPAPQSLADFPEITIAGQTWRMDQNWGAHKRLTLEYPIRDLPKGEVVITYRRTAVANDIVIGANGVRTQVRLSTDFPLIRSGGPRPQEVRSAGSGADWLWTIDRSATFNGVTDTADDAEPAQKQGFLGIQIREPEETGDIDLYSTLNQPVFSTISGLVQFTPLAYAAAALMVFFCRVRGYWPQLGLALVGLIGLAMSLYAAQRVDEMTGWSAGAAVTAIGAAMVLWQRGRGTATAVAFTFAAAWAALLLVPTHLDPTAPLPLSIVALRLSQPAAFLLGVLAAMVAAVQFFVRRRAIT